MEWVPHSIEPQEVYAPLLRPCTHSYAMFMKLQSDVLGQINNVCKKLMYASAKLHDRVTKSQNNASLWVKVHGLINGILEHI